MITYDVLIYKIFPLLNSDDKKNFKQANKTLFKKCVYDADLYLITPNLNGKRNVYKKIHMRDTIEFIKDMTEGNAKCIKRILFNDLTLKSFKTILIERFPKCEYFEYPRWMLIKMKKENKKTKKKYYDQYNEKFLPFILAYED